MTPKIVLLTGNDLRHQFFRKKIALDPELIVLKTYCESEENLVGKAAKEISTDLREKHLQARLQSEKDFFELFVTTVSDHSNPIFIQRGTINDEQYFKEIIALKPDLVIVYGASIIREPLLSIFHKKMINIHLGLSPYYRGSATNFWPLVHGMPECVGVTFMYIDAGIDTGEIIHQLRASVNYYDSPSSIGNRLIADMTRTVNRLVKNFALLQKMESSAHKGYAILCKKKDYTEESVKRLYENFSDSMILTYIENIAERNKLFPIIQNPALNLL